MIYPGNGERRRAAPDAKLSWRTALRWGLVAAALLAVATILWLSVAALTPFIIGLILAYLMAPLVNRLEQRIPRWAAILIVYLLTFGALGLALTYVIPPAIGQINQVIESIPGWYEDARTQAERWYGRFNAEASPEV